MVQEERFIMCDRWFSLELLLMGMLQDSQYTQVRRDLVRLLLLGRSAKTSLKSIPQSKLFGNR